MAAMCSPKAIWREVRHKRTFEIAASCHHTPAQARVFKSIIKYLEHSRWTPGPGRSLNAGVTWYPPGVKPVPGTRYRRDY